jgi:hypothetical protein
MIFGMFVGMILGCLIVNDVLTETYEIDNVIATESQCNIEKPANTICKWEATWKPVPVIEGE